MLSVARITTLVSCMVVGAGAQLNGAEVAQEENGCTMPGTGHIICTQTVQECTPAGVLAYCGQIASLWGWQTEGYSCVGGTVMQCIWYVP